jgi:N-acetylmuramoyl-L-alanine amidase
MDDSQDIDITARTLYGEARGEGKQGIIAVACVIVTRAMIAADYMDAHGEPHPLFGDGSLASACQAPLQFSCWNKDDPNLKVIKSVTTSDPVFSMAVGIATEAENDQLDDITDGATHYYAKGSPMPEWAKGKTPCVVIGSHLFFNNID